MKLQDMPKGKANIVWRDKAAIILRVKYDTDFGIRRLEIYNNCDKYANGFIGKNSQEQLGKVRREMEALGKRENTKNQNHCDWNEVCTW